MKYTYFQSDNSITATNQRRTNTADFHHPGTNNIPQYMWGDISSATFESILLNHSSSISTKHGMFNKPKNTILQRTGDRLRNNLLQQNFLNLLFFAFGHNFDIVLYPDHKYIQSSGDNGINDSRLGTSRSIFYHGYLKGMKEDSDVSLIFNDMKLVSGMDTLNINFTIFPIIFPF